MNDQNNSKKINGFSTLLTVIILGSISLSIAIWMSTSSLWSLTGSIDSKVSEKVKALVNACAEVALEEMADNNYFFGNDTVTIDGDDCNYEVIYDGGTNRTITVTGTIGNITRELEITTSDFNSIVVDSWLEAL